MARAEAGFEMMETYIQKSHNTVAHCIATRSILDLYEVAEKNNGARVGMWWWKQVVIDL